MSSDNTTNKGPEDGSGKVSPSNTSAGNQNSSGSSPHITRVILSSEQLDEITLEDLRSQWRQQDIYINSIETLNNNHEGECTALRESEEKLKQQLSELAFRERALVRRLAAKEQDLQEYANQLSEMKGGQAPGIAALRSALLDPAVNILLQKLRQELSATRTRLDDTQNELAAWKFTPDSNTGKRLMAKCRLLYQENEELGRMISSGRLAKLEGDLALQKSFSEEVKKSQSELDELLQDLDEDVEGMQSTIYYLQQELRKAKETVVTLEQENSVLRNKSGGSEARGKSPCLNGLGFQQNGKWCLETGSDVGEKPLEPVERTRDTDEDSVVNKTVDEEERKRTTSENSDDNQQTVKKPRSESHLYNDDQVVTNGDISGQ